MLTVSGRRGYQHWGREFFLSLNTTLFNANNVLNTTEKKVLYSPILGSLLKYDHNET